MKIDRESQILMGASGLLFAGLARWGGGDWVGVLGYGMGGMGAGATAAIALSTPKQGPLSHLKERIFQADEWLGDKRDELEEALNERGLTLIEVLEYSTLSLIALCLWSVPFKAGALQSLGLTACTTLLWIHVRVTLFPNPGPEKLPAPPSGLLP
ncbi:MAG: hypothetical protein AB7F31_03065 [Parachlamydiales bacterium]